LSLIVFSRKLVCGGEERDLVTEAADTLREWILDDTLPMGARLNVVQLAARLNLSRTPVREALSRLTAEGFATFVPNRGHFVVVYSVERVAEIYVCRAVLESEAARLAARAGIPAGDEGEMADIIGRIDDLLDSGDDETALNEIGRKNNRFHELIYANCGNSELQGLIAQVTTIPRSIRNYFRFTREQRIESNRAHRSIHRAVVDGDGERAWSVMREHIWAARDRMLPAMSTAPASLTSGGMRDRSRPSTARLTRSQQKRIGAS
jgi:GntR family transcriptional regulator, vanillate catabolism transcriptional regulator